MSKKVLIRSGMLPFESISTLDMLNHDKTGTNNGNLIYQYGISRTLMNKGTEIYSDKYSTDVNNYSEINEKYDCYVIALADAFRDDFRPALRRYTQLINKLTIPVYVIGAGVRAPVHVDIKNGFSFDEDVKNFIKAVLNKSQTVGLRGQITSDYLTHLGFKEGVDHQVIGCPSMYTFGRNINILRPELNSNSFISINASTISNDNEMNFIYKISEQFNQHCFIPQYYKEIFLSYLGGPSIGKTALKYPGDISSKFYMSGKVKFFMNAPSWFDYMRKADFSIGTRLHGNIVATINETPNITIVRDARMKELADYHSLTHVMADQINDKTNLQDLIDSMNFEQVSIKQRENFDNYINFLNKNEIDHIYKNDINRNDAPLDYLVNSLQFEPPITPITIVNDIEKFDRLNKGLKIMQNKFIKEKETITKSKDKIINSLKKGKHPLNP